MNKYLEWTATTGIGCGLIGRILASTATHGLLAGVRPLDPATFVGVGVVMLVVGAAACWLPAQRATRVNPVEALRTE